MVMPRAFSSGALSMESNARKATLGFDLASTLVMALVRVVLPWSMCPMVPMFTCGFDRSNFSFAIVPLRPPLIPCEALLHQLAGGAGDDFFGDFARHLGVLLEVQGKSGAALCARAQIGGVAEHSGQRHSGVNDLGAGHAFHPADVSAGRSQEN